MSILIRVDESQDLLSATLLGPVSVQSFIEELEHTLSSADLSAGFNALIDMREVVHSVSGDDVGKLARHLSEHPRLEGTRAAIVVTQTVTYGLMRMLQTHMDEAPMAVSVFYDLDEAKRWLGLAAS
jgi:hypothetical protein